MHCMKLYKIYNILYIGNPPLGPLCSLQSPLLPRNQSTKTIFYKRYINVQFPFGFYLLGAGT